MAINQLEAKLKFTGAYKCPHLGLQQVPQQAGQKRSCCGGGGPSENFVPICTLVNGVCPGLVNCPRLDLKTKSELIQQWRQDLKVNKPISIQNLLK